ncbi:MAG: cytochrome c oxidase subunit 3 [Planctomycetaceae bacterium]|nr:cytochrome c oxidase subunit 3 [Planctomycetaceae bacterium]
MAIPFDERPLPQLTSQPMPSRHADGLTRAARLFVVVVIGIVSLAILSWCLISRFPLGWTAPRNQFFPLAFAVSSVLLLFGSVEMSRALRFVRMERQREFRRSLFIALIAGGTFWGVQTYGLWLLMPHERTAEAAQSGVNTFVVMLAALHGMHFVVAVLFLSYVTVRALADRYDHEYYWGVSVAAWFWHALGVVWIGILAVFAIAAA